MNPLDWIVVSVYVAGLIWLSYRLSRGQHSSEDYYLAGRSFRWWHVGLSTMATQLGAVSFISAPAFVGLREQGGLQWLTYELAVPLAMILLMVVILPPLYRSGVISIYAWLETRYGPTTRRLLSGVFQFSRAFAAGITIYAVAMVLAAVFAIPLWLNIVMVGLVALVYDYMGGMKAVVISDVIQMGILLLGFLLCSGFALHLLGGWQAFLDGLDRDRLLAVDFTATGLGDGEEFGFWPMVLGGFFLYAAYYGCDQSQAQRMLSSMNERELRRALLFNGLMRFPTVLLYCLMGLLIGTLVLAQPEFAARIPADRPDYMVPVFIAEYLPHGLIGLLVAAIMAAAMSSLDSALNSLSAATVEDFVVPSRRRPLDERQRYRLSRRYTLFWGVICVTLAFAAGSIAPTVIEAINKIGSLFYGPVIATFLLGMLTRSVSGRAMNVGIVAGVGCNLLLWLFFSEQVFWFWWNLTGFLVTAGVALLPGGCRPLAAEGWRGLPAALRSHRAETLLLSGYFVLITAFSMMLAWLL